MKCKMIWIAQHPEIPDAREVSFKEPDDAYVYVNSCMYDREAAYVEWKQYVMFEVEEE